MADHIGEIVQIAQINSVGVINDHVAVQPHWDSSKSTYHVYARSAFDVKYGPEPQLRYGSDIIPHFVSEDGRQRGWGVLETVAEGVPLEEALELGTAAAQQRNVVLYLATREGKEEIKWHPDGWEPATG